MSDKTDDAGSAPAGRGVVVIARNGEVIGYDSTGLVMRLSDKVIADIGLRLGTSLHAGGPARPAPAAERIDPHELLEKIDAWDVRQDGEWLFFTAHLPGRQGVRGFRREVDGGAILADAPGPLFGILGIGGPRAALANQERSAFPHYVLAPADDIGAVGHFATGQPEQTHRLEPLREMTHEALIADTMLGWQLDKFEALPLFMARVETDSAASAADLVAGAAFSNMIAAARNLVNAARHLGKKPQLLCVTIDYALEDISGSAAAYRDSLIELMRKTEAELAQLGLEPPVFVARLDSGACGMAQNAALEGQWELGWNHGDHRFIYSAPAYMFAHDEYDRPTPDARREMAEMTAAAVAEAQTWLCPTFYLAEFSTRDPRVIRLVARASGNLVLDESDPFDAGPTAGIRLVGATNDARVQSVAVDPEDPQTLLLTLTAPPQGTALYVAHAYAAEARPGQYYANSGSIRDDWSMLSATGRVLNRWALPCLLPVTAGGGDA
ncbi:MAG: hypothetical protein Q4G26_00095 [Paracoccus sp. (in: a-proteobacteria)]|nr:hypothetical protein [Paracoccus sp. (in: a-proteobacteria)]